MQNSDLKEFKMIPNKLVYTINKPDQFFVLSSDWKKIRFI